MRKPVFFQLIKSVFILLVLLLLSNIAGCKKPRTVEEQLVIDRLRPFWSVLEDYKVENFCYPDTWEVLLRVNGMEMPENPYTGQPMVSLESSEFDPLVSPGNIYYVKVVSEDCVVNCQVIIFGENGEITRYTHAGPLAPN